MAEKQCPVCKAVLAPGTLPEINGHEGSVALTVHRMPVLVCTNGHRQFAHPDFPLQLLDHLVEHDEATLPASTPKGMLIKHYHCASCGERLDDPADQPHTFHLDVELPNVAPFDVELTLPVHRCHRCGHEQVHSLKEVRSRTPAALAHAFKGAAITAPA
jgi:hypothetical protein